MKIVSMDVSAIVGVSVAEAPAKVDHSEQVEKAVRWLFGTPRSEWPHPMVPALQRQFGLSARDACAALREFNLVMARAL